jgi:hypothetical protein
MPQAPIIIPLIITGVFFGSLLKHRAKSISKKSVALASVAAGLLNGVHAYLLDTMSPQPTTTFTTRASFAFQPAATVPFVISAIGVGILIVLLVIGVAAIYRKLSRGREEEPVTEEKPTDETLG